VDESRLELLRRGYDALNRRDLEGAMRDAHPDIEIFTSGAFLDAGTVYRGLEGLGEFLAMLDDAFERLEYELEEAHEVDADRVLALIHVRGRGKGSGVEVDIRAGHLWTLRDEKALRMQAFATREEALAAVGLT
jgi:ketosteroid isomerase-like protein